MIRYNTSILLHCSLATLLLLSGCGLLVEDFTKVDGDGAPDADADTDTDADSDTDTDSDSDLLACADDSCDPNATCAVEDGAINCTCNTGFSGDGTTCNAICAQQGPRAIDAIGGTAKDIAVQGDVAYVLLGPGGLYTFDVSTPDAPVFRGKSEPLKAGEQMVLDGDYVYVADEFGGLVVIDVSDVTNPTIVGNLPTVGSAVQIVKNGSVAYAITRLGLVQAINVSDPTTPVAVSEAFGGGSEDNFMGTLVAGAYSNNTLYVMDSNGLVHRFPASGQSIYWSQSFDSGETGFNQMHIEGDNMMLSGYWGLYVMDVGDLTTPAVEIGDFYKVNGATFSGNTAYITGATTFDGPTTFMALDLSALPAYTELGNAQVVTDARTLALAGNDLFVAGGQSGGFSSLDISTLAVPGLSHYALPGDSRDLAVAGDTIYVADGYGGIKVIQRDNLTAPAAHLPTLSAAQEMIHDGNFLYVRCMYETIIVDVTDPAAPTIRNDTLSSGGDILLSGDTLLVSNTSTIWAYDITDKDAPTLLGGGSQSIPHEGLAGVRGTSLVTGSDSGIQVLDISDPALITVERDLIMPHDSPTSIHMVGDQVFTTHSVWGYDGNGIALVDMSDLSAPQEEGFIPMSLGATLLGASNDTLYFWGDGLQAVDISDVENPGPMGVVYEDADMVDSYEYISTMHFVDTETWIPANEAGIQILDISQPIHPAIVDAYKTHIYVNDIVAMDGAVYVGDQSGLEILASDQGHLSLTSYLHSATGLRHIFLDGDTLYATMAFSGLAVYDLSDPTAAVVPDVFSTGTYGFQNVAVRDGVAYVGTGSELFVTVDVSDPTAMTELNQVAGYVGGYSYDVQLLGNQAYVVDSANGLLTFDITDPEDLTYQSVHGSFSAMKGLQVTPEYVYVAEEHGGVNAMEISALHNPVGQLLMPARINDMTIQGDRVYVGTEEGLVIGDISDPTNPQHLLTIPINATIVAVDDGLIYVGNGRAGVTAIDPRTCAELQ